MDCRAGPGERYLRLQPSWTLLPLHLRQEPEHDRPRCRFLLQVDQQLAEAPGLGVPPELADPVGAVEVREAENVEQLGAGSRAEGIEAFPEAAFEFIWPHCLSLRRRIDGRVTGVHAFSDGLDWDLRPGH